MVRPLAEELISRIHAVFEGQRELRRQDRDREIRLQEAYAQELLPKHDLVTDVHAEMRGQDERGVITLTLDLTGAPPETLIADQLNAARPEGQRSRIAVRRGQMVFAADVYAPDEVEPALRAAIERAAEAHGQLEEAQRARQAERLTLVDGLQGAFGDLSDPTAPNGEPS